MARSPLRQSKPLRQITSAQDSSFYRNAPGGATVALSRRAMRSGAMKRVLIIEDDRDIVELVRYNLANEGFQVSAAYDGSTGLATLPCRRQCEGPRMGPLHDTATRRQGRA